MTRFFTLLMPIVLALMLFLGLSTVEVMSISNQAEANTLAAEAFCDEVSEISQTECDALLALYNQTDGANWTRNSGWLKTTTPCSWHGITCSEGHVARVSLLSNQLSGTLPAELANLSNLTSLNLVGNQLSGSILSELGNLSNLTNLNLSANQFSGHIPPELGNLTQVLNFYLANNQLSGSIPAELGNLSQLQRLWLHNNQLSGEIPATLSQLTGVTILDLGYNLLQTDNESVLAWLEARDPDWSDTQTLPPTNLAVTEPITRTRLLTWTPITYIWDSGYYQISYALESGGPYTMHGTTTDKAISRYMINDLDPERGYYFIVQTFTEAHDDQKNDLLSLPSTERFSDARPPEGWQLYLPLIIR